MTKMFCSYCGKKISKDCGCEELASELLAEAIFNYENSLETHLGWHQYDVIESYRMER